MAISLRKYSIFLTRTARQSIAFILRPYGNIGNTSDTNYLQCFSDVFYFKLQGEVLKHFSHLIHYKKNHTPKERNSAYKINSFTFKNTSLVTFDILNKFDLIKKNNASVFK